MAAIALVLAIGAGSIVAVGGYIWSLDVAAVKAESASLDGRIDLARAQVRQMRTELVIRTRLIQQERWAPALGLQTPDPRQFGRSDKDVHTLAEARQAVLTTPHLPATPRTPVPQTVSCVHPDCGGSSGDARPGYEPAARRQLDGLIGAYLH
jgi:hypothetical protein